MEARTKVYLAARYGRRLEMCKYKEWLEGNDYEVTSRWLKGEHEMDDDKIGTPGFRELTSTFATDDMKDLYAADIVICFTEDTLVKQDSPGAARGGRHVELGMAIAWGKKIIVVGPMENVFYGLMSNLIFETWKEAQNLLAIMS